MPALSWSVPRNAQPMFPNPNPNPNPNPRAHSLYCLLNIWISPLASVLCKTFGIAAFKMICEGLMTRQHFLGGLFQHQMTSSVCWVVSKDFEVGRTVGPIFRCKWTAICSFSTLWWTWLDIKEVAVICSSCMRIWRHTREEIHLDWFVLSDLESFPHKSVHKDTICEESAGYFTRPTKSVCLCFGDLCIGLCVRVCVPIFSFVQA